MKLNIIGITLGVILGVPAIAFGSSFTYSMVQGQSPSEAIATIGSQLNSLFGRVDTIEAEQQVIVDRLNTLEKDSLAPASEAMQSGGLSTTDSEPDLQLCAEMKENLVAISTSLQEKKALLKKVKSTGRESESIEDFQTQLNEVSVDKNSLEGNTAQLEVRQKELVEKMGQESCI